MYIKNYRPISLLTVDYKIFAKMLANRLKKYLHNIVNPDQSGSILINLVFLRVGILVTIFV